MEQTTEIDKLSFHKLNLGKDEQKEKEPLQVTQSLVPPLTDPTNAEGTAKDEKADKK